MPTIQRWVERGNSCRAYTHLTNITTSNSFRQSLDCWNQRILCPGSLHPTIVLDLLCRANLTLCPLIYRSFITILRLGKIAWDANESGCTCTWEELDKPREFAAQGQALRRGPLQRFRRWSYLPESCFAPDYATYSLGLQSLPTRRRRQSRAVQTSRFVGKRSWPVATWVQDFKQFCFVVTAKTTPLHHSSLQIEVVVLDFARRYQSSKLVGKCCMKCSHG